MNKNIIDYLPKIMQDLEEFKQIMSSEQPQVTKLWNTTENIINEAFIEEETEIGAKRWEAILKISPFDTDSLELRNFRILSKVNETLPYTYKKLGTMLDILCKKNGYEISLDNKNKFLVVKLELINSKNLGEVNSLLERILPLNIKYNVELIYNTHKVLSKYTYGHLARYAYNQLRNEVLS